jgi:hypothetical protein
MIKVSMSYIKRLFARALQSFAKVANGYFVPAKKRRAMRGFVGSM